MLKRCPHCSAVNPTRRPTCSGCGAELRQSGFHWEALTYWNEQVNWKLTAICSAIICGGVLVTVLLSNIVPTVAGLLLAGLYYLKKYDA